MKVILQVECPMEKFVIFIFPLIIWLDSSSMYAAEGCFLGYIVLKFSEISKNQLFLVSYTYKLLY